MSWAEVDKGTTPSLKPFPPETQQPTPLQESGVSELCSQQRTPLQQGSGLGPFSEARAPSWCSSTEGPATPARPPGALQHNQSADVDSSTSNTAPSSTHRSSGDAEGLTEEDTQGTSWPLLHQQGLTEGGPQGSTWPSEDMAHQQGLTEEEGLQGTLWPTQGAAQQGVWPTAGAIQQGTWPTQDMVPQQDTWPTQGATQQGAWPIEAALQQALTAADSSIPPMAFIGNPDPGPDQASSYDNGLWPPQLQVPTLAGCWELAAGVEAFLDGSGPPRPGGNLGHPQAALDSPPHQPPQKEVTLDSAGLPQAQQWVGTLDNRNSGGGVQGTTTLGGSGRLRAALDARGLPRPALDLAGLSQGGQPVQPTPLVTHPDLQAGQYADASTTPAAAGATAAQQQSYPSSPWQNVRGSLDVLCSPSHGSHFERGPALEDELYRIDEHGSPRAGTPTSARDGPLSAQDSPSSLSRPSSFSHLPPVRFASGLVRPVLKRVAGVGEPPWTLTQQHSSGATGGALRWGPPSGERTRMQVRFAPGDVQGGGGGSWSGGAARIKRLGSDDGCTSSSAGSSAVTSATLAECIHPHSRGLDRIGTMSSLSRSCGRRSGSLAGVSSAAVSEGSGRSLRQSRSGSSRAGSLHSASSRGRRSIQHSSSTCNSSDVTSVFSFKLALDGGGSGRLEGVGAGGGGGAGAGSTSGPFAAWVPRMHKSAGPTSYGTHAAAARRSLSPLSTVFHDGHHHLRHTPPPPGASPCDQLDTGAAMGGSGGSGLLSLPLAGGGSRQPSSSVGGAPPDALMQLLLLASGGGGGSGSPLQAQRVGGNSAGGRRDPDVEEGDERGPAGPRTPRLAAAAAEGLPGANQSTSWGANRRRLEAAAAAAVAAVDGDCGGSSSGGGGAAGRDGEGARVAAAAGRGVGAPGRGRGRGGEEYAGAGTGGYERGTEWREVQPWRGGPAGQPDLPLLVAGALAPLPAAAPKPSGPRPAFLSSTPSLQALNGPTSLHALVTAGPVNLSQATTGEVTSASQAQAAGGAPVVPPRGHASARRSSLQLLHTYGPMSFDDVSRGSAEAERGSNGQSTASTSSQLIRLTPHYSSAQHTPLTRSQRSVDQDRVSPSTSPLRLASGPDSPLRLAGGPDSPLRLAGAPDSPLRLVTGPDSPRRPPAPPDSPQLQAFGSGESAKRAAGGGVDSPRRPAAVAAPPPQPLAAGMLPGAFSQLSMSPFDPHVQHLQRAFFDPHLQHAALGPPIQHLQHASDPHPHHLQHASDPHLQHLQHISDPLAGSSQGKGPPGRRASTASVGTSGSGGSGRVAAAGWHHGVGGASGEEEVPGADMQTVAHARVYARAHGVTLPEAITALLSGAGSRSGRSRTSSSRLKGSGRVPVRGDSIASGASSGFAFSATSEGDAGGGQDATADRS